MIRQRDLECQRCGEEQLFYTRDYAQGPCTAYFHADGTEAENGEFHQHLFYDTGKIIYCGKCNRRVRRTEEVIFDVDSPRQ